MLTTPDLAGLKQLINQAAADHRLLMAELSTAVAERYRTWRALQRAEQFPLKMILQRRLPKLQEGV